ncbi:hypothetical protein IID62_09900, partial [candidate division KSB1 bacterium]|nr:hypothetical protein [candidate division KSB1 bacterium]
MSQIPVSYIAGTGLSVPEKVMTNHDLEKIDAKQNVERHDITGTGKVIISPTKNTDILFSGSYNYQKFNSYIYSYSLFNSENNPQLTYKSYRVLGRYTQRFGNDQEDKEAEKTSMLQNAYYTVQADYSKERRLVE